MNRNKKPGAAVLLAVAAALFYAVQAPFSKILMEKIPATFMASFLYLGAGIGVSAIFLLRRVKEAPEERLTRSDFPYVLGMILLDIAAPILMMFGIRLGTASGAALLGNFETVATAVLAFLLFGEAISKKLGCAVLLISVSGALLTFDGVESLRLSAGSLFVLGATLCWGLENNCTRRLSEKSAYRIVILKGFFSGGGAALVAFLSGEALPPFRYAAEAMALGFVAYGLSIFVYVRAQRSLGAARTGAFYALAPFIGAALSFLLLKEPFSKRYLAALLIMLAGTGLTVWDSFAPPHHHKKADENQ